MKFRCCCTAAVAAMLAVAASGWSMSAPIRAPKSPLIPSVEGAKGGIHERLADRNHPRSKGQIRATIEWIKAMPIRTVGQTPTDDPLRGVHVRGRSPDDRDDAMRELMIYRYLADVPWKDLVLDRDLNVRARAGAELMSAARKFGHHPPNPGWPAEAYNYAHHATSSSNLCMSFRSSLVHAIHEYFDDSDSTNIWRLGHRRWALNPQMARTGMGGVGAYTTMWAYDRSRQNIPDYDYIAFPARGYMPLKYFGAHYAWNVSLNPKKYRCPNPNTVSVRVYKADRTGRREGKPMHLNYFKVNTEWCGIPYCVIFRPRIWWLTPGNRYVVHIDGLQKPDGTPTSIEYLVEFFRL